MFESLSDKLDGVFRKLKGYGKLSENNIKDGLKDVRLALLEADVHYKVVKKFIEQVKNKAVGEEVLKTLTPTQQLIKIVDQELTELMGASNQGLNLSNNALTVIMLAGLQGAGKTTTAAKLASFLRKEKKTPLLISVDIYRPAAIDQLKKVGAELNVPVFDTDISIKPEKNCINAISFAKKEGFDTLIIDTAGRMHIDEKMMQELVDIKKNTSPLETLFVADAMTGQDAVNSALSFDKAIDISGIILTKMDGDAKGGAALSIKSITGKPIKFIGVGEKLSDIKPFYPDRMAQRILGMGDTLSLIERAQELVDQKKAVALEKKIKKNNFTLEDFKEQLLTIRKMGSLKDIMGMIPGVGNKLKNVNVDENEFVRIEAIINSMTFYERENHSIIKAKRKIRIAKGSGTKVQDVNKLLNNYNQMLKMMKKINLKKGKKMGSFLPF